LGRIRGAQSIGPYDRLCGRGVGRTNRQRPNGIPPVPRNNGQRSGRRASRASTIRLQDRPPGRRHGTLGAYLPPLRSRTADPSRMAQGDGKNRENTEVHVSSGLTHPFCPKTERTRPPAMRGLSRAKRDHNPLPIPAPINAGATRPGTRLPVLYENGSQERIQSY